MLSGPRPRGELVDASPRPRRGGRVVDRAALEMRSTRKCTGGSNPSLSATALFQPPESAGDFPHKPFISQQIFISKHFSAFLWYPP